MEEEYEKIRTSNTPVKISDLLNTGTIEDIENE